MPDESKKKKKVEKPKDTGFASKVISFIDNLRPTHGTGSAAKAHKDISGHAQKLKDQEKAAGI